MDVSLHNPPFVKDEDEGIPAPQITSSPFDLPFSWPGSIGYQWAPLIFEQRPEGVTWSLLENMCRYAVSKRALSSPAVQPGSGPTAPTLALTIAAVHSSVPSWGTFPPGKQGQTQKFCFFFFECCKPYVRQKGGEMTAERARHRGSHPPPLQLSRKHPVRNAFCTGTFLEIINCKRWRLVLLGACDSSWVFRDVLARRVRWSELIRRKAPCHRGSSLKSIRAAPSSGKRYFSCNKNLFPLFICLKKKKHFFFFSNFPSTFFFCFLICFSFFSFFSNWRIQVFQMLVQDAGQFLFNVGWPKGTHPPNTLNMAAQPAPCPTPSLPGGQPVVLLPAVTVCFWFPPSDYKNRTYYNHNNINGTK